MYSDVPRFSNRPQFTGLHVSVYRGLLASGVAMFLTMWTFFSANPYTALQLSVVAVFLAVFAGVPLLLGRLAGKAGLPGRAAETASFADWLDGDFSTCTGPVRGHEAAVMVLVAPAAVVLGLIGICSIASLAAQGAI